MDSAALEGCMCLILIVSIWLDLCMVKFHANFVDIYLVERIIAKVMVLLSIPLTIFIPNNKSYFNILLNKKYQFPLMYLDQKLWAGSLNNTIKTYISSPIHFYILWHSCFYLWKLFFDISLFNLAIDLWFIKKFPSAI